MGHVGCSATSRWFQLGVLLVGETTTGTAQTLVMFGLSF